MERAGVWRAYRDEKDEDRTETGDASFRQTESITTIRKFSLSSASVSMPARIGSCISVFVRTLDTRILRILSASRHLVTRYDTLSATLVTTCGALPNH